MDNSIKQLILILIVLLIKLFFDIDLFFLDQKDISITNPLLFFVLPSFQILALILVFIISFSNLKSKEPSNKFRNYIYIALSIALLATSTEFLIEMVRILLSD